MSSSCRPRKYHGALEGLGVKLKLARGEERGVDHRREDQEERGHGQGGHELAHQQVGPHVHLVGGGGLDVLDGAGLDDREQALGVTLGALGRRGGSGGHRGGGGRRRAAVWVAVAVPPPPVATAAAGGRGSSRRRRRRRPPPRHRRPRAPPAARGRRPARLGARPTGGGGVRGRHSCVGLMWVMLPPRRAYSGPEMPPSLRTRQKWMAMKMTMMNGNSSTWSTYHRSRVSVLISTPPRSTNLTCDPNTGV